MELNVSESLENYLRVIYEVQSKKDFARVKDITNALSVKTASVADALKKLQDMGLVDHKKYGYIKLTPPGILEALKVYEKHNSIVNFLKDVIFMNNENECEELACGLEHHLNEKLLKGMESLTDFFIDNPNILKKFQDFSTDPVSSKNNSLDKFPEGCKLRVVKIFGSQAEKEKLLVMGILPGTDVEVERISGLDSIEVKVRGFRITLRKDEARLVFVTEAPAEKE